MIRMASFRGDRLFKAIGAFATCGGLIFLLNRMVPKLADDYPFSFIWDGKNHGNLTFGEKRYIRVRTAKDLVKSQASHYMTWSGRTVGETMNQLVQMKDDKLLFDCLNTGASIAWIIMCIRAGRGKTARRKLSASTVMLAAAGWFLSTPHLAATSMWATGTTNYSWPGLFQFAFLMPYAAGYRSSAYSTGKIRMALSGILAGWSNEAGGGTAVLLAALATISSRGKDTDTGWMTAGLIGVISGYMLLMLAPGNFRRIQWEKEYSDILPQDFTDPGSVPPEYVYTRAMFSHHFKNGFLSTIRTCLPMQVPVLFYFLQREKCDHGTGRFIVMLEGAAIMVPAILMFSPQFPLRAAFLSGPLMVTAAVTAFENTERNVSEKMLPVKKLAYGALGCTVAVKYISALFTDADIYMQTSEQVGIMKASKHLPAVIPDIMISPFWLRLAGDRTIDEHTKAIIRYEENPDDPYNKAAAAYYGAASVTVSADKDHPYNRKDRKSRRIQICRPVSSFFKRLAQCLYELSENRIG